MADREVLYEHVMEPGTGKAVPVMRGQILRIEQIGNGQCADFNADQWIAAVTDNCSRNRAVFPQPACDVCEIGAIAEFERPAWTGGAALSGSAAQESGFGSAERHNAGGHV